MVAVSDIDIDMRTTKLSQLRNCNDVPLSGVQNHGGRNTIHCKTLMNGRHVIIYQTRTIDLTLCEVQVLAQSKHCFITCHEVLEQ